MHYIGIDHHKRYSYGTVMDGSGKVVWQGKFVTSEEGVREVFKGWGETKAVLEAGRNWGMMYDWMEEMAEEVKLAHPKKVKAIADAKIKTDKIDSRTLAHLLRADLIPEAHVPGKETREAKQVLRQRMFFIRVQTMVKNRIRILLERHPELEECPSKVLFSNKGMEWLKRIKLPDKEREILDGDISLLEEIKERVEASNELVERLAGEDENVKYLESIPGIGKFFGVLLAKEIDDVKRFRSDKKLHAYCGLVPSTYSSGERTVHGRITKQGNKWVRWAMVEAVWPAIQVDGQLRRYYEQIKSRRDANTAKVATAKRLLTIVYRVLKEKRFYQVRRLPSFLPGCSSKEGTSR